MYKVTCSRCGQAVQLSQDTQSCTSCGENLQSLLTTDEAGQYFYERASELAVSHGPSEGLDATLEGLEYCESTELYLLGAVLAKEAGQFDVMRACVSAIPLDSMLRTEGEWLLRSHQDQQRALREGVRTGNPLVPVAAKSDTTLEHRFKRPRTFRLRPAAALLIFTGLIWLGWTLWGQNLDGTTNPILTLLGVDNVGKLSSDPPALFGAEPNQTSDASPQESAPDLKQANPSMNAPDMVNAPTIEGESRDAPVSEQTVNEEEQSSPALQQSDESIIKAEIREGEVLETASPTPEDNSIPDDVVLATPEPIAARGTAIIIPDLNTKPFDLLAFLIETGYSQLARLPVDAQLRDGQLILTGVVPFPDQRNELIEIARTIPNVEAVDAVNLLVRLPDTYIVDDGDTLWVIAFKLYEDGPRWPEIYDYNRDILDSPEALRAGMVLKVPK